MQRIDKGTQLSTKYKEWLEAKESKNENHPKYSSSDFRFYNDIKFDLFRCQKGLCAYTEMRLCRLEFLNEDKWEDGKYLFEKEITKVGGQLDHFDPNLKKDKAWLWDNFFMTNTDINRDKSNQPIDEILKPDKENFDPLNVMEFNFEKMVYIPNSDKTQIEQDRIERMIGVLGVNYPGAVYSQRKRRIEQMKKAIELEVFDETDYDDFPTIVRILKNQLEEIKNKET